MARITHGLTDTPTYKSWHMMKQRCKCKKHSNYKSYGGRGIRYDPRWEKFIVFLKDMGERPLNTTLDRINVNKGYYKKNCRWATAEQQYANKRNNKWVTYKGKHYTLAQLSEAYGFKPGVLRSRIVNNNWPVDKAVQTPPRRYKS